MTLQDGIAEKSATLAGLAARLRAELKASRRAVVGLLAIACLAAGYGLLGLDDAIIRLRGDYVEAAHRLDRLAAARRETDWLARAASSARLRRSLEARLWHGDSEGMARADLQDWVTNNAREAGLKRMRVAVELTEPKGLPGNLRQVTATITALDTEAPLITFLDRIAREKRLLIVDHLVIRQRPMRSMEMKLVAYTVVKTVGSPAQ